MYQSNVPKQCTYEAVQQRLREARSKVKLYLRGQDQKTIWVQGTFPSGENFARAIREVCGEQVRVEVIKRNAKGFEVLPKRWIVERTFGWLNRYRRLSKTSVRYQRRHPAGNSKFPANGLKSIENGLGIGLGVRGASPF